MRPIQAIRPECMDEFEADPLVLCFGRPILKAVLQPIEYQDGFHERLASVVRNNHV